jgi:uncharacterized membrane protein
MYIECCLLQILLQLLHHQHSMKQWMTSTIIMVLFFIISYFLHYLLLHYFVHGIYVKNELRNEFILFYFIFFLFVCLFVWWSSITRGKKRQETASLRVAYDAKCPSFFFPVIPPSPNKTNSFRIILL